MADAIITRRGGSQGESKPLDLPISIQLTQPTPVRVGHLWIKADIASQVTNIVIDRALKASVANGTIQLIVPLDPHKLIMSQNTSISETKEVPITMATTYSASKWALTNISLDGNIFQMFLDNYPIVYSKLNGILDIETSFIWNGTIWVAICTKGKYLLAANKIYNYLTDNSISLNYTMPNLSEGLAGAHTQFSGDGRFAMSGTIWGSNFIFRIYSRVGDVWSMIWENYYHPLVCKWGEVTIRYGEISKNGRIVFLCHTGAGAAIIVYEVENGVLVEKDFVISTKFLREAWQLHCFVMNDDASRIAFPVAADNTQTGTTGINYVQIIKKGSDGKYALGSLIANGWGYDQPNMSPTTQNSYCGFIDNDFYGVGTHVFRGKFDDNLLTTVSASNFISLKQAIRISEDIYVCVSSGLSLMWYNNATGANGTVTVPNGGLDSFHGGSIGSSDLQGNIYCTMRQGSGGSYYAVILTPTISNGVVTAVSVTKWLVNLGVSQGMLTRIAPQL